MYSIFKKIFCYTIWRSFVPKCKYLFRILPQLM